MLYKTNAVQQLCESVTKDTAQILDTANRPEKKQMGVILVEAHEALKHQH